MPTMTGRLKRRFERLQFRQKIVLLPGLAAVALMLIFVVTLAVGLATERRLTLLERGDYPSLQLSHELAERLAGVQRAMQDAVEADDAARLATADTLHTKLLRTVRAAESDPYIHHIDFARLDREIAAYYAVARRTSERLIAGDASDAVTAARDSTQRRYAALRERLRTTAGSNADEVERSFTSARLVARATWVSVAVLSIVAVALLLMLSRVTSRSLVGALRGAVTVADRLSEGDMTVRIPDVPDDEVGHLLRSMQRMTAYLQEMSTVADRIAAGDLLVRVAPRSEADTFGRAFDEMIRYLTEMSGVAAEISAGNLGVRVIPRSETDGFGIAFVAMVHNLSQMVDELRASERHNRRLADELFSARERLDHLLSSSPAVIYSREAAGDRRVTYISANVATELGHEASVWLADEHFWSSCLHPDDAPRACAALGEVGAGGNLTHEYRLRHRDGGYRWVRDELQLVRDAAGAPLEYVGYLIDITERKQLEAQLTHQAFHDTLTGLANRTLFRDRVEHALTRRERHQDSIAVLFLDVDNFKAVNDSLGHAEGDRLLVTLAERLLNATRGCDTVARLGGDEFAILLDQVRGDADVLVARRITEAMRRPIVLDGKEVFAGTSIGIARSGGGDGADDLLRNADLAMYMAKNRGKGCHALFEPAMHQAARDRLEIEADLRAALDRGEFRLLYQPIVELANGRVTGVEALARWQHPQRGIVSPATFIPIAEETGLIVPLGRWVLEEACRQGARWQAQLAAEGAADASLTINVNLSGRQLQYAGLVDDVASALRRAGLDPQRLVLEITESVVLHHTDATLDVLHALKRLGVSLAIDDFGTGYSSLSYLQRFPVDILKIDKAFVDPVGSGTEDPVLARAIIALGDMLALRTVAEGIETEAQRAGLQVLGCELGQGFNFARPIPANEISAMLSGRVARDGSRV